MGKYDHICPQCGKAFNDAESVKRQRKKGYHVLIRTKYCSKECVFAALGVEPPTHDGRRFGDEDERGDGDDI